MKKTLQNKIVANLTKVTTQYIQCVNNSKMLQQRKLAIYLFCDAMFLGQALTRKLCYYNSKIKFEIKTSIESWKSARRYKNWKSSSYCNTRRQYSSDSEVCKENKMRSI